jgi:hypothetical protein
MQGSLTHCIEAGFLKKEAALLKTEQQRDRSMLKSVSPLASSEGI